MDKPRSKKGAKKTTPTPAGIAAPQRESKPASSSLSPKTTPPLAAPVLSKPAPLAKVERIQPSTPAPVAAEAESKPPPKKKRVTKPRAPKLKTEVSKIAEATQVAPSVVAQEQLKPEPPSEKIVPPLSTPTPVPIAPKAPSFEKPAVTESPAAPTLPKGLRVPSILLEGDQPAPPPRTGPGEKFALTAETPAQSSVDSPRQLPTNYGTEKLTGVARDPQCLFAHWDFTDEQQRYYNSLSADHHLVLRARFETANGPTAAEAHLHTETRHWFLHVPRSGSRYVLELGYYLHDGTWVSVRASETVTTPPDQICEDRTVHFAVTGRDRIFASRPAPEPAPISDPAITFEVHETIQEPALPEPPPAARQYPVRWTVTQEKQLAELISTSIKRRQMPGSLEILELLQRQVERELISVEEHFPLPAPSSLEVGLSSPKPEQPESSPFGGMRQPPQKDFWFNISAELIIYGATEPDAIVTIGGRPIKLRADGSFSYRFALPDGLYDLPVAAAPKDLSETRHARLRFSRHTHFEGTVGAHPQDPALRPPQAENVA